MSEKDKRSATGPDEASAKDKGTFDMDATQILTGNPTVFDMANAPTVIMSHGQMAKALAKQPAAEGDPVPIQSAVPPTEGARPDPEATQIMAPRPVPPPPSPAEAQIDSTVAISSATSQTVSGTTTAPIARNASAAADPASTPTPAANTLPQGSQSETTDIRKVGRYQIHERLGRGGMATVFRAHDPGIGRDVAIKFLHASLCEDEGCRTRFLREAGAAGRLSHPNIAIVHDVGEIAGRPYMAMELLTGVSLAEELNEKKTLPVREVVTIGIELATALHYAHGRGIIHRDIKPANIMRMADSETIKVTDFGIAHIENPTDESTDRTRAGDILGTPQYMSPEQARGDRIDGRSDLFSVGIVLYQMLTGVRPFRGESLVAVATKIATEEPTPLEKLRGDVPAALRRVVDRCLAKQPANRYQSGAELAEALTKVLAAIDEAAIAKERPRIVPLRVKWAATMALIVAVVMGLTATVITQRQVAAMMSQVSEYGASLARFIAAQNAAAVLGEDWESVEVAVQEIMKTRNFERVVVVDLGGIVRVSSVPGQTIGAAYAPPVAESLSRLDGNIAATRYLVNGESVLGFESPITFHDKQVGKVALGIPEKPLTQVARLSITLMIILAVVTVLAVAIAMYFVADWFAKPVRLLSESMAEIAKGRFDHRIAEKRKDEFGQLFEVFDAMASALQLRQAASQHSEQATIMGSTTVTSFKSPSNYVAPAPDKQAAPASPGPTPPAA
jgi:serine/threonine-protein kinase